MWHHLITRVFATFDAGTQVPPHTHPTPHHLLLLLLLSLPQPSVPYKHTKLSVRGLSLRQRQFCDISPGDRLPMTTRGPQAGDITNPRVEGAKQLATHRGGLESCELGFQPQRPNGYSGQGTERNRETGERVYRGFTTLEFRSPPSFPSTLPLSFHLKWLRTAVGI